jgi:hypothetical protein
MSCSRKRFVCACAVALAVVGLGQLGWAQPQRPSWHPVSSPAEFFNDTSSTVLPDLYDPLRFYVLPPSAGTIGPMELEYGPNIAHCEQLFELQETSRELTGELSEFALSLEPFEARLDELYAEVDDLRRQAAAWFVDDDYFQLLDDLLFEIELQRWHVEELCLLHGCESTPCPADIQSEISELEQEILRLVEEHAAAHEQALADNREYARLMAQVEDIETEIEELLDERERRLADIVEGHRQIVALYSDLARLEGGTARFEYRAPWEENVRRLALDNRILSFEKIAASDVRVNASLVPGLGSDGYLALNPMVLRSRVNGVAFDPDDPQQTLASYPVTFDVEAVLSLVAACVQRYPDRVDVEHGPDGLPQFALSLTYAYPLTSRYRGTVHFNLWRVLQFIMDRGGLRQDRLVPNLSQSIPPSAFRIRWYDSDLPAVTREAVRQEQLEDVVAQVLRWATLPRYFAAERPRPLVLRPSREPVLPSPPSPPEQLERYALDRELALDQYERGTELTLETVLEERSLRWESRPTVRSEEPGPLRVSADRSLPAPSEPRLATLTLERSEPPAKASSSFERSEAPAKVSLVVLAPGQLERSERPALEPRDSLDRPAMGRPSTLEPRPVRDSLERPSTLEPRSGPLVIAESSPLAVSLESLEARHREARLTVVATRELDRRLSPICGWHSLRCPGLQWLPPSQEPSWWWRLRRLLDADQRRELSQETTYEQSAATVYVP